MKCLSTICCTTNQFIAKQNLLGAFLILGMLFSFVNSSAQSALMDVDVTLISVGWGDDIWCADGVVISNPAGDAESCNFSSGPDPRFKYRIGYAGGNFSGYKYIGASNSPTGGPTLDNESDTDSHSSFSSAFDRSMVNVCGNVTIQIEAWEEDVTWWDPFDAVCPGSHNYEYNSSYNVLCSQGLDGEDDLRKTLTSNASVDPCCATGFASYLGGNNQSTSEYWMSWDASATLVAAPSFSSGTTTICVGGSTTLTSSSAESGTVIRWYTNSGNPNGSDIGDGNSITVSPSSTTTYYFAQYKSSGDCIGAANSVTVTVLSDPSISASSSGTICSGGNRTLTSSTSGGTGCSYQWQISSTSTTSGFSNISGATSSTYNTGSLTATRYYRVRRICSGTGCNNVNSNALTVTVVADPSITSSGGGTICVGGNRTLTSSTSGGTGTCTYQWQISSTSTTSGFSNISGATSSTYNTGSLSATRYYRVVRNCNGSGCADPTSNVQTVTVVADPSITSSGGGTICVGGNRTLTSSTSGGTGTCTYQWQISSTSTTSGFSNISGATSSTYNTGSLSATRYYRVQRICNGSGCNDPFSNVQTVTVVADPSVSISGGGTICEGGNRTLTASTSGGTGTCTFQWQRATSTSGPWTNVGTSSSTYNTGSLTSTFVYRVLRNCNGSGCNDPVSNTQTVTVVADPTITASGASAICSGGNANLTSSTSGGTGTCTYQWQISSTSATSGFASISGATSSTLNTGSLTGTRWYRVLRNCNGSGCADPTSNAIQITVVADPSITSSGGGTICVGGNRTLTSSTSGGTGTCTYQWQISSTSTTSGFSNISGATSSTYNTGSLSATRYYRVQRICNGSGCNDPFSNVQTVTVVADPSVTITGSGTICEGGNRTLTASTSGGTGTCTFQWQRATSTGGPWTNVGTSSSTYNTGSLTSTFVYRVLRNCNGSGCNDPVSNTQTVTVVADPTILASGATNLCPGGSTTLTSSTSGGTGTCTYQWQSSITSSTSGFSNISGATSAVFSTGTLIAPIWYRVVRSCDGTGCADAISNAVEVTVSDTQSPNAVCQNITAQLGVSNTITVVANDIDNGSTDNCSIASLSLSGQTIFNCDDVGSTFSVSLTVTDGSGNQSSCSANVTVADDVNPCCAAPQALCQTTSVLVFIGPSGTGSITVNDIDAGSTADCGLQSITIDKSQFDCDDVNKGIPVTLTITDINGDSDNCTGNVFVTDDESPTLTCPSNMVVDTDLGSCNAVVNYTVSSADNCPSVLQFQTSGLGSGATFPIGTTTESYTATDAALNQVTCTFTVTVVDNEDPTASCQDVTVQLNASGNGSITAQDVDGGSSDACGIASLSVSPSSFTCANVGANIVTLTVTDVNGNSASCTATATVEDNEDPTASCQDVTVQLNASGNGSITAQDVDGGSSDACGIASLSVSPSSFTCANVGANIVTLTVTDVNGNSASCTATATVEDNEDPTASCQDVTVQLNASGNGSITAQDVDGGSSDACGIASLSVSPSSFTCANVGANIVTLIVTDVNGNSASCTATATVEDNEDPTAICQDVTVQLNASGNGSITAQDVDGGSSDACGIASLSVSPSSFTCANVGANIVTLIVTDVNGNSASCTATATVEDNEDPTADLPRCNGTIECFWKWKYHSSRC